MAIRREEYINLIDFNLSVYDNVRNINKMGINVGRRAIENIFRENHIECGKEKKNKEMNIMEIFVCENYDKTISRSKNIAKFKELGVNVSVEQLRRIETKYDLRKKEEVKEELIITETITEEPKEEVVNNNMETENIDLQAILNNDWSDYKTLPDEPIVEEKTPEKQEYTPPQLTPEIMESLKNFGPSACCYSSNNNEITKTTITQNTISKGNELYFENKDIFDLETILAC